MPSLRFLPMNRSGLHRQVVALCVGLLVSLGGCESHPRHGREGGGPAAPIPTMEAEGNFFAGKLTAEVRLGRSGLPWQNKENGGGSRGGFGAPSRGHGG